SGTEGSAVGLTANLVVGSPIQLQTSFPPGTVISSSHPITVKWTGGDPGALVRVSLNSGQGAAARSDYSYADAAGGSLIIAPYCTSGFCSFGLPLSANAQIIVQVLPDPTRIKTITLPGVTGPVQATWQYVYNFSGLSLGP